MLVVGTYGVGMIIDAILRLAVATGRSSPYPSMG